jgi:hydroxymethylglutaryl-CoA synthase
MDVGISYIDFYIPKNYLDIEEFSINRNINGDKLKKGLGIEKMAFLDVHEDTATMAANALNNLIEKNDMDPLGINRIYLGTESALDSSKPTATYAVDMVEQKFGKRVFKHTDVVDMTFACVGAVDVLQNALDYVRVHPEDKVVVIASDFAKYDLESPGEYTQGAGAVALLVESAPQLMSFSATFGVGFKSAHDFFKPRRQYPVNAETQDYTTDKTLQVYREEPVFDGQFSNQCYQNRIREAYFHYKSKASVNETLHDRWSSLIFHLPYASHGKRIFTEIYQLEKDNRQPDDTSAQIYDFDTLKALAKSDEYRAFVQKKINTAQLASGQIGNMYSASIFMSLISELVYKKDDLKAGERFGFIAYGSGSKAKVFEGHLAKGFASSVNNLQLEERLADRQAIDFETYEQLHRKVLKTSVNQPKHEFVLKHIANPGDPLVGNRVYEFIE